MRPEITPHGLNAELTDGTLLGGRVVYRQFARGHRSGVEPVLLAASLAARPGERVIEAGTGAGAGALCLAARLPALEITGLELDPALAALAADNAAANGFRQITIARGDVAAASNLGQFDHAIANPPWHDGAGTVSADAGRALAKRAPDALPGQWAAGLAACLRPRGSLTLILPSARLHLWLAACGPAGCGSPAVLPLWPRAGREAKLALLRVVKGGRGPLRLLPGLVLHAENAGYTEATESVLRDGTALAF